MLVTGTAQTIRGVDRPSGSLSTTISTPCSMFTLYPLAVMLFGSEGVSLLLRWIVYFGMKKFYHDTRPAVGIRVVDTVVPGC